jgi:hypothetical protein
LGVGLLILEQHLAPPLHRTRSRLVRKSRNS